MVIVISGSCVFRILWVLTVFAYFRTIASLYLVYICNLRSPTATGAVVNGHSAVHQRSA